MFSKRKSKKLPILILLGILVTLMCLFYLLDVEKIKENLAETFSLYKENEILRENIEQVDYLNWEIDYLKSENANLKDTIKMNNYINEQLKYQTEIGTVIKREHNKWLDELVVYSNNSYSKGIVMTSKGLVGKINEDNEEDNIHIVQLITDGSNNIASTVEANENIQGIIRGYDKETGLLRMEYINNREEKIVGQNVISSGKGGIYPYGLIIGKINEIKNSDDGLSKIALIKPSANLNNINNVIIITD